MSLQPLARHGHPRHGGSEPAGHHGNPLSLAAYGLPTPRSSPRQRWSELERRVAAHLRQQGYSYEVIADVLQRSMPSVRYQLDASAREAAKAYARQQYASQRRQRREGAA
jgi:hypothetical protein